MFLDVHTKSSELEQNQSLNEKSELQKNGAEVYQTLFRNAEILHQNGDLAGARVLLTRCLQMKSNWAPALRLSIKVFQMSSPQKLAVLRTLLIYETSFENYSALGHCLYDLQQFSEAKEVYFEGLSSFTQNHLGLFEVYKNLGNIFTQEGDWDAAEEYYTKALAARPGAGLVRCNLGFLEIQRGDLEAAENYFSQGVLSKSSAAKAWCGLALISMHKNENELCFGHLLNCLELEPGNRPALQTLGQLTLQTQNFQHFVDPFAEYLSLHPFDSEIRAAFIHLLSLSGDSASEALEKIQLSCLQR